MEEMVLLLKYKRIIRDYTINNYKARNLRQLYRRKDTFPKIHSPKTESGEIKCPEQTDYNVVLNQLSKIPADKKVQD